MKIFKIKISNLYISLILFLLAFLNTSRNIDNDLGNYIEIFNFFKSHSFFEVFGNLDFLFSVKPTEPIFYLLTYLLSKLFFGKVYLYIFFITLILYTNYLYGLSLLFNKYFLNTNFIFAYYFIVIFGCINFAETSHLLRQYFAGSLIPLFFYYLLSNRLLKSILLSFIIVLTHNSLLIILLLLFISYYFLLFFKKFPLLTIISTALIFYLFQFFILKYLYALSYLDEPSGIKYISIYYDLLILLFYFSFSIFLYKKLPKWNIILIIFTLLFILFLTTLIFSETLFLRFYINIEWFRFFYFYIILISLNILHLNKFYKPFFYCLIFLVFILRIYVSPWNYFTFEIFTI